MILGLRRAGVTEALTRFEERGLVRKKRGVLQLYDRGLLEQKACGCYGIIANAYDWTKAPESAEHEMRFDFQIKPQEFQATPEEL